MINRMPEDHDTVLSALPEIRAHFEQAAKRSPCHAPILDSIVRDLDMAERHLAKAEDADKPKIADAAKANLAAAHMGLFYYPSLEHDFERAITIFDSYSNKAAAAPAAAKPAAPKM